MACVTLAVVTKPVSIPASCAHVITVVTLLCTWRNQPVLNFWIGWINLIFTATRTSVADSIELELYRSMVES